jgi:hypothetical protein
MSDLVGGRSVTVQFFDGENYDVFVLSVGLHHFLCLVYNGQEGNRHFGAVTRFGRRAAEDLVALLGASAFIIDRPSLEEEQSSRRLRRPKARPAEDEELLTPLPRAEVFEEPLVSEEPQPVRLEPIQELDPSIFDKLDEIDENQEADLFDPERLAELAKEANRGRASISYQEAKELGFLP